MQKRTILSILLSGTMAIPAVGAGINPDVPSPANLRQAPSADAPEDMAIADPGTEEGRYYIINFYLIKQLEAAYKEYSEALKAQGVPGYVNNYVEYAKPLQSKLDEDFRDLKLNVPYGELETADDLTEYETKKETLEKAINEFKDEAAAYTKMVDDNNAAMKKVLQNKDAWDELIAQFQDPALKIPVGFNQTICSEFQRCLERVEDWINNYMSSADRWYKCDDGNGTLRKPILVENEGELDWTATDVNAFLTEDFVEDYGEYGLPKYKEIFDIVNGLNSTLAETENTVKGLNISYPEFNIYAKVESDFEDVKTEINDLRFDNAATSQDEIKSMISAITPKAQALRVAVDVVINGKATLLGEVNDLETFVNKKGLASVPTVGTLKEAFLNTQLPGFQSRVDGIDSRLEEINNNTDYDICLDEVVALPSTLEGLSNDMLAAKETFAKVASETNCEYAQEQLADFKKKRAAAVADEVFGVEKEVPEVAVGGATVAGSLSSILSQLQSNVKEFEFSDGSEESGFTTLDGYDDEIQSKILDKITEYNNWLDKLRANQEAYDALNEQITGAEGLDAQLKAAKEYNTANALPPANNYFGGRLDGVENEINTLKSSLETGKEAYNLAENQETLNAKVSEIKQDIVDIVNEIDNNNKAKVSLLNTENEVRILIEGTKALIEKGEKGEYQAPDGNGKPVEDILNGWIEELTTMLDNGLPGINVEVVNAYREGQCAAKQSNFESEYDTIRAKAEEIREDYLEGADLAEAIYDANGLTTSGWKNIIDDLNDAYVNGINDYNYYNLDLTNEGWKAYVIDPGGLQNHEGLFEFRNDIAGLKKDFEEFLKNENTDRKVITAEKYAEWTAKANVIDQSIATQVTDLTEAMYNAAVNYWEKINGVYTGHSQNATNKIKSAFGLTGSDWVIQSEASKYLSDSQEKQSDAQRLFSAGYYDHTVSEEMDRIANLMGEAEALLDLQPIAKKFWVGKYEDAETKFNDYRTTLEASDPTAEQIAEFNGYVEEASKLNGQVLKASAASDQLGERETPLIDQMADLRTQLETLLSSAETLAGDVKAAYDEKVANDDLYKGFIGDENNQGWKNETEASISELKSYCDALAAGYKLTDNINGIESALTTLAEVVEEYKGHLTQLDPSLESRENAIANDISSAYQQVRDEEWLYLNKLVDRAKVAYNNTEAAGEKVDKSLLGQLNNLIREVNALKDNFSQETNEEFKQTAVECEQGLCEMIVTLEGMLNKTPAADVRATLDEKYDEVADALAKAQEFLGECLESVKEQYSYTDIAAKLEAEKESWTAEGDDVIARKDWHEQNLNIIADEIASLNSEISNANEKAKEEQAKKEANDTRYQELYDVYEDLSTRFENAKAAAEGYGNKYAADGQESEPIAADAYLVWLSGHLSNLLEESLTELNAQNKTVSLTPESTLPYEDTINTEITAYRKEAAMLYFDAKAKEADAEWRVANGKLATLKIIPAEREKLQESLDTAKASLDELKNSRPGEIDPVEFNENRAQKAVTLAEEFRSIAAGAEEYSYVLGDLTGEGDVNVLDLQELISLVGRGVTYAGLYDENPREACAADVAGNGVLNIADVTALVRLMLGEEPQTVRVQARVPAAQGQDAISVVLVSEEEGVRRYALVLNNTTEFVGAQFDLNVSGNSSVVGVSAADRAESHEAYQFDDVDGATRVLMVSMENASFTGNAGTIAYIDVEGSGDITVSNAIFADRKAGTHLLGKAFTSGVDAMIDGMKEGVSRVYDAAGRILNRVQKGINIIRHKDGNVTKEMRKK